MNVAISSQGNDIHALVDPRFGRARWFVIADSRSGIWRALDNSVNRDASGGAGVQAGTTVVAEGAEAVVTGAVGPNALKVLAAAGIAVYQADEGITVREALERLARDSLPAIESAAIAGR